jgi:uncharacterized protein (TIRG00374 family)
MEKGKNLIKKYKVFVLFVFIAWFIYFFNQNFDEFKKLSLSNPQHIIPIFFLVVFQYFIIGSITKNLVKPLKLKLRSVEAFGLSIVSGFYNMIAPFRAGMAVRALYLKKKYNFLYSDFVSALFVNYILIFWIGGFLGILSIFLIYISENVLNLLILSLFILIFVILSLIIMINPQIPETRYPWINRIIQILERFFFIKEKTSVLLLTAFLSLLQLLNTSFMLYLQFQVFDFEITFVKSLFLAAISYIGAIISITPASLGVKEAMVVLSATTIGITPIESLSVVLLGRFISILILFTLGPFFSYYFSHS